MCLRVFGECLRSLLYLFLHLDVYIGFLGGVLEKHRLWGWFFTAAGFSGRGGV